MRFSFVSLLLLSAVSFAFQIPMQDPNAAYIPERLEKPTLADLLTIEKLASIFYSYARELDISAGLSDEDARLTLFVPTNKAVMALSRKPHQSATREGSIEISEQEQDDMTRSNVERWVSAHVIPEASINLNGTYETLNPSKPITFSHRGQVSEWMNVYLNDGIRIIAKKEAINGDLYMIDGALPSED